MAMRVKRFNEMRRWPRPQPGFREPWNVREKRLLILGYRAQSIGYRHAQRSPSWLGHFLVKSQRLLDLALAAWRDRHA